MSLHLRGIGVAYGRRAVFANADLVVPPGEVVGLIGPNGAGKTTLLRVAAGMLGPVYGQVAREGRLMYFGGEATLPGACSARRWARLFDLHEHTRRPLRRLSRGTRQMLGLKALVDRDDWDVGLLDEPWEGLDPDASEWLSACLRRHRERGAAVLVSSHRLHDVTQSCSAYAFLAHGVLRAWHHDSAGRPIDAQALMQAFRAFTA